MELYCITCFSHGGTDFFGLRFRFFSRGGLTLRFCFPPLTQFFLFYFRRSSSIAPKWGCSAGALDGNEVFDRAGAIAHWIGCKFMKVFVPKWLWPLVAAFLRAPWRSWKYSEWCQQCVCPFRRMWTLPTAENVLVAPERNWSDENFELTRSLIFLNLFEKSQVHVKQTSHLEGLSNVLSANSMDSKDSAH